MLEVPLGQPWGYRLIFPASLHVPCSELGLYCKGHIGHKCNPLITETHIEAKTNGLNQTNGVGASDMV